MKLFKLLFCALSAFLFFAFLSTSFTSCTKTDTVHDTTTITIRDTITVRDTVTVTDTLGNLSDGLVAYYNFNNGSLKDSSGHGNDIIFSNAALTSDRFGNANNAYLFSGDSTYMRVPNSASINPNNITLYAIVKVNSFFQGQCHGNQIFSKGWPYGIQGLYQLSFFPIYNGDGTACAATIDSTKEIFGGSFGDDVPQGYSAGAAGNSSIDSVLVQKDQWYTLAYTYDGATAKFYVNGALAYSLPNQHSITFTPNTYDLLIGKHENPLFPYYFHGVIDEIRIYNKAITNEQIGYLNILKSKYLRQSNRLIY
ncbi:MAG TPA: LamG domain-containing protein [Puia sp.]|nr:LamG domain-containing protein [Puia sp.]